MRIPMKLSPLAASLLAVAVACIPGIAAAEQVPVLDARPFFGDVTRAETGQQCVEQVVHRGPNRLGQIAGGVIGGYAGSQFGSGRGRQAATVAGALYGSELGRRHIGASARTELRCGPTTVTETSREVAGYDVIYEQDGRLWRTRTTEHPGTHLNVPPRGVSEGSGR